MYVFIIGNPGVGKSAICNSLGAQFKSGISVGYGLTTQLQTWEVVLNKKKYTVVDAPGLYDADDKITCRNADEIREGLCKGADYKIVFAITLQGGSVLAQDINMMKSITRAIKATKDQIAIIINKVDKEVMKVLNENNIAKLHKVLEKAEVKYKCFILVKFFDDMQSSHSINWMKQCVSKVIDKIASSNIDAHINIVSNVVADMQENMAKLQAQSEAIRIQNEMLERRYEEMLRKCSDPACSVVKASLYSKYCIYHQCAICCERKMLNSDYCYVHRCLQCNNGKTLYSNYCSFHRCPKCHEGREYGYSYCYRHKNDCSIM